MSLGKAETNVEKSLRAKSANSIEDSAVFNQRNRFKSLNIDILYLIFCILITFK